MNIIFLLIILGLILATGFLITFMRACKSGQFNDCHTPALRILLDDDVIDEKSKNKTNGDIDGTE